MWRQVNNTVVALFSACGVLVPATVIVVQAGVIPFWAAAPGVLGALLWVGLFPFAVGELLVRRERLGIFCAFLPVIWFASPTLPALAACTIANGTFFIRAVFFVILGGRSKILGCGRQHQSLQIADISRPR